MTSSVILTQLILLSISQQAFSRPSDTSDDGVETQPDNYLLSFGDGVSGDLASRAVGHESATVISASTYNAGSKPPSQTKPGIVTGQGKPEASSTGQANPTGSLNPSLTTPSSGSSQPKPPGSSQTFSELLSSLFGSSGGMGSEGSSRPPPFAPGGPQFGWSSFGSPGSIDSQRPNRPPPFVSGGSQSGQSSFGGSGAQGSQRPNRPPPFSSGGLQSGQSSFGSSSSSGIFPGYMAGFMQPSQAGIDGFTPPPPPSMMTGSPFGGLGNTFGGSASPFGGSLNPFGGSGSSFGSDGGLMTQSGPAMLLQQDTIGNSFPLPPWGSYSPYTHRE